MNPVPRGSSSSPPLDNRQRLFALAEVVLAAAVVIGHNVYHILPNEVPILVAILWVSLLIRKRSWASVGLRSPSSLKRIVIIGVCAAALLLLKELVTEPVAHLFWHSPEKVSSVISSAHNPTAFLESLAIVCTFGAFGEEFAYRALLLRRMADAMNRSRGAYAIALVVSSILFGFGHFYKGPAGVFNSSVSGLILGGTYLVARRNLWAPIIAHGMADTIALILDALG